MHPEKFDAVNFSSYWYNYFKTDFRLLERLLDSFTGHGGDGVVAAHAGDELPATSPDPSYLTSVRDGGPPEPER